MSSLLKKGCGRRSFGQVLLGVGLLAWTLWVGGCSFPSRKGILIAPKFAGYTATQIATEKGLDSGFIDPLLRYLDPSRAVPEPLFQALEGGMTSTSVYAFSLKGRSYVLRFFSPKQDLKARENEIRAHQFAASLGLAPPLRFVDEGRAFTVMDRIPGRPLNAKDLHSPARLRHMGQMLARLASYAGPFSQVRTQADRVHKHTARAAQNGVAFPSIYPALYSDYQRNQAYLASLGRVLSHGDLNPSNIWITPQGRLYWIDWTSASWDHPYADLAYFSMTNGLNPSQSADLLQGYLGYKASRDQGSDFSLAQRQVAFLTATTWFDFSESEAEKSLPLALRVEPLDRALSDPSLPYGQALDPASLVSVRSEDKEAIKRCALSFLKTFQAGAPFPKG